MVKQSDIPRVDALYTRQFFRQVLPSGGSGAIIGQTSALQKPPAEGKRREVHGRVQPGNRLVKQNRGMTIPGRKPLFAVPFFRNLS